MWKQTVKTHSYIGLAIVLSLLTFSFGYKGQASTPKSLAEFPEGERLIYTQLVEAFRRGQIQDVMAKRQILERNYPASVHLDNAYYLTGMLEFQNGRFGEALKDFDVVRYRFTKSNKRPSALFATAMTYERLNLGPQARRVLQALMQEYPGSPEAQRAAMHLKVAENSKRATKK